MMEKTLPLNFHLHEFQFIDFVFLNQHGTNKQEEKSIQNACATANNTPGKQKSILHFQIFASVVHRPFRTTAFQTEFGSSLILKRNSR